MLPCFVEKDVQCDTTPNSYFDFFYTMTLSICFLSADPSNPLGRLDYFSFSQETLMELLIENFTNREYICGSKESPKDVSEWNLVSFNDAKKIVKIDWGYILLEGSIELKWMPPTTEEFHISYNKLTGTVDLTCLPEVLETLNLVANRFHGEIDLTKLPPGLKRLLLARNAFCGKPDLRKLPKSLVVLNISETDVESRSFGVDESVERKRPSNAPYCGLV